MVCTLRLGANSTDYFGRSDYSQRTDLCFQNSNLLGLLFPRQFEMSPVLASTCVDANIHQPNEQLQLDCVTPSWCNWKANTANHVALTTEWSGHSRLNDWWNDIDSQLDELCDTNGLTWPELENTTDLGVAWPAYDVGCQLNLSRHICQLPPLPSPPPPTIIEMVDELFHRLFVVVVAVGVTVLVCVLGCLCRRYRVEQVERLEARVADERNGNEIESEWEEALIAGKRKLVGAAVDSAGLVTFDTPRSGQLWSNGW